MQPSDHQLHAPAASCQGWPTHPPRFRSTGRVCIVRSAASILQPPVWPFRPVRAAPCSVGSAVPGFLPLRPALTSAGAARPPVPPATPATSHAAQQPAGSRLPAGRLLLGPAPAAACPHPGHLGGTSPHREQPPLPQAPRQAPIANSPRCRRPHDKPPSRTAPAAAGPTTSPHREQPPLPQAPRQAPIANSPRCRRPHDKPPSRTAPAAAGPTTSPHREQPPLPQAPRQAPIANSPRCRSVVILGSCPLLDG